MQLVRVIEREKNIKFKLICSAARIHKKLASNPEVLSKLKKRKKDNTEEAQKAVGVQGGINGEDEEEISEKTPNQVAQEVLKKLKNKPENS